MDPATEKQLQEFSGAVDSLIVEKIDEFKKKQAEAFKAEKQKKGRPLSDYLTFINFFSSNASTVNRSLALGGIAIIWLFKKPEISHGIQKDLLNTPLLLLALSLALDLVQYFFGAVAWKIFYERKYWLWKKKHSYENDYVSDITAPNFISTPIYIFWFVKIIFMMAAYYYMIQYLRQIL